MRKADNNVLMCAMCIVVCIIYAHGSSIAMNDTLQLRNEPIDPCSPNPCKNFGICSVGEGNYVCTCIKPFTGKQCENHPCHSNPCENEGACIAAENGYGCVCQEPFTGKHCEIDPCSSKPCKNGGECKTQGISFSCSCIIPFSGKQCEEDPCSSNPCRNGGKCSVEQNNYKCSCQEPYFGEHCEKDPCFPNPCQNGGACKIKGNDFSCTCKKNFSGKLCEIDPCSSNPCRNGGECSLDGNNYKCYCKKPYRGKQCELDCDCGNNSISCKLHDSEVICECKTGYAERNETCSATCNIDADCLNDGRCKRELYNYFCQCRSTFSGDKCETDVCETLRSKCDYMRATCTRVGDIGVCKCPPEKVYNRQSGVCEDICGSRTCLNGKCVISGKNHKCICDEGFSGSRCDQRIIQVTVLIGPIIVFLILCIAIVAFAIPTIVISCQIKKLKKTNSEHVIPKSNIKNRI